MNDRPSLQVRHHPNGLLLRDMASGSEQDDRPGQAAWAEIRGKHQSVGTPSRTSLVSVPDTRLTAPNTGSLV
jgi:hypothetical protein